jgi:hypothetical protein
VGSIFFLAGWFHAENSEEYLFFFSCFPVVIAITWPNQKVGREQDRPKR